MQRDVTLTLRRMCRTGRTLVTFLRRLSQWRALSTPGAFVEVLHLFHLRGLIRALRRRNQTHDCMFSSPLPPILDNPHRHIEGDEDARFKNPE